MSGGPGVRYETVVRYDEPTPDERAEFRTWHDDDADRADLTVMVTTDWRGEHRHWPSLDPHRWPTGTRLQF